MRIDMKFDDVERKLRDLQTRARALHGHHQVPLGELVPPAFMAAHTDCSSLDELFERGGITVTSQADFEQIPEHELDQVVAAHTHFTSWSDLVKTAGQEWMARQLGL